MKDLAMIGGPRRGLDISSLSRVAARLQDENATSVQLAEASGSSPSSASSGLFSKTTRNADAFHLSGALSLGRETVVETSVQGTKVQLMELRLRAIRLFPGDQRGRIALTGGTDLRSRHRLTLESMIGSEEGKHSVSNVVSRDSSTTSLAWGVGTSHRLADRLRAFTRFSSDASSGHRFILQAVHTTGIHTISPICSFGSKGRLQAGLTWKTVLTSRGANGDKDESLQARLLCGQTGTYSLFVKAQFGEVD